MYQKILFSTRSNASAVTPLSPTGKLLDIFHLEIYVELTNRDNKMNVLLHKLYVCFCRTLSHMQMYSFFASYPAAGSSPAESLPAFLQGRSLGTRPLCFLFEGPHSLPTHSQYTSSHLTTVFINRGVAAMVEHSLASWWETLHQKLFVFLQDHPMSQLWCKASHVRGDWPAPSGLPLLGMCHLQTQSPGARDHSISKLPSLPLPHPLLSMFLSRFGHYLILTVTQPLYIHVITALAWTTSQVARLSLERV